MFIANEVATQLIRSLRDPLDAIRRRDKALADQLRRAGSSVLLNIAEGRQRVGLDRTHHFRVAAGSAAEVRAALIVAREWGYCTIEGLESSFALVDRQIALLWGLTRRKG